MKRMLSTLLAFILLFIAIPAMADNVRTSGLYTYEIKGNGTITITDFNWDANGTKDIFIPNMIDGYTVTAIGDSAFACNELRHSGFQKDSFKSVSLTIPDSVKSIGEKAFWNATLSSINIPTAVQVIDYGAFVGNPTIQFKVAPGQTYFAVIDGALYNKSKKELIAYPHYFESYEQYRNTVINIPEGILSIGDYAFYRCVDTEEPLGNDEKYYVEAKKVNYPSTLQSIGNYAFFGVSFDRNTSNPFPNTIVSIGKYAYANTRWISGDELQITIPPTVKVIGEGAFMNLDTSFGGSSLTIASNGVISDIEKDTFRNCELFIDIRTNSIRTIGDYAFSNALSVTISDTQNIASIGKYTFAGFGEHSVLSDLYRWGEDNSYVYSVLDRFNYSPSEFVFPPLIDTISEGFYAEIEIPASVKAIESGAFDIVNNYRLPATLADIASDAFASGSTFIVEAGSYAELWCSENGFGYTIEGQEEDLSWLN